MISLQHIIGRTLRCVLVVVMMQDQKNARHFGCMCFNYLYLLSSKYVSMNKALPATSNTVKAKPLTAYNRP